MGFFDGLRAPKADESPAPVPAPVTPPAAAPVEPEPKPRGRLNELAFNFYRSLGEARTFGPVAQWAGVTESAVARYAKRHRWEERIHNESPQRAAEVSREVQIRVRQKTGDLVSADPAGDAEKVRRVKKELLTTGLELLELGKKHLEMVALAEPKDVMRCIELGAKLMQAATETDADKSTADVVLLMRQKLAALTGAPPPELLKDAQIVEKKENDNG